MAEHRAVHFGGELVHPQETFIVGEDPMGNAVYMTYTTDSNSVTTFKRAPNATADRERVAELRWSGTELGIRVSLTRDERELPMGELANIARRPPGTRAFVSKSEDESECSFLWVRLPFGDGATHSYNLLDERTGLQVGHFDFHGPLASPEGVVTYATFNYAFHSEVLFLDAMMSLYVNRFLDSIGRAI
ncbi:hypothetical protein PENSPDRAFT_316807 [Peniophora sp. CONT]|nr:hypothetical protein PENSPDRAFT_316807 [Peniophora sp. CONT]